MKTITFAVPCYNSTAYMDHCVETLLACGEDIEILLVDDGSTKDDTAAICDRWQNEHPDIVRAIHQPNKGHGGAVNTGLANASGFYFKVVDSDDWLDPAAMFPLMVYLRSQLDAPVPCDMVVANYVYDKVDEGEQKGMGYGNVLPEGYEFGWDEVGTFLPSQYLLMHSVYYRTEMLRKMHLELPEHTFYVDNIFVYEPLVYVRTMRYFNVDAYHYFIGREDQSVNEKVMGCTHRSENRGSYRRGTAPVPGASCALRAGHCLPAVPTSAASSACRPLPRCGAARSPPVRRAAHSPPAGFRPASRVPAVLRSG